MENTSNESFLRQSFTKKIHVEELLCRPEPHQVSQEVLKESAASDEEIKPFRQEPLLDFAKTNARNYFQDALEKVQAGLGEAYPPLIDGKEVYGKEKLVSINPLQPSQESGHTFFATKEEA